MIDSSIRIMKEIFFVTGNQHKYDEAKKIFEEEGIRLIKSDAKLIEHKLETEKEISIAKSHHAMKMIGKPLIVEDTGLYLDAYDNFPGTNAGAVIKGVGVDGILRLLEGKERGAQFRTVFTFHKPGNAPMTFEGICKGNMAEKPSEMIDFPYDTIFTPDGMGMTFSEMTKEDKQRYSHRAKALRQLIEWLKQQEF